MASPSPEAIDTFISITGVSEAVAIQKLQAHGGDLNEAVNAHFTDGDRNNAHETSVAAPQDDLMDIDDPIDVRFRRPPFSLLSSARNPLSILDRNFHRSIFDIGTDFTSRTPSVSHPREVREIPIEFKDGNEQSSHSGHAPTIEDVTGTEHAHGPEIHGTVIIDDEDVEDTPVAPTLHAAGQNERNDDVHYVRRTTSATGIDDLTDYSNDIEEEMIRAAIEASKHDAEIGYPNQQYGVQNNGSDPVPHQMKAHLEDAELAHVVSMSSETVEQEKALCELGGKVGVSELEDYKSAEVEEQGKLAPSNGRLELGSSSVQDEAEDVEEQPLVRHRSRHMSSGSVYAAGDIGESEVSPPSSPQHRNNVNRPQHNGSDFSSDEWGGISSEEHDEAVMLEAALFGGIPEGSGYHFPYAPHQLMQNGIGGTIGPYTRTVPRPPSPSLATQRLIRGQQDDEYFASLQADREKEMKVKEEVEARRLEKQAAREAALEEERRKEEESRRKLEEEQAIERQIAAKEASLHEEPAPDNENAVTLLVRMPDGSRRGRRFLKSDKLQCLFDFIDVGRGVKPGTYRLVRPYPRRAFSDGESASTLSELLLTSKQEALYLELI